MADDGYDDEYKKFLEETIQQMKAAGLKACEHHGWQSMNWNGTCEICRKEDFPEDFKDIE